MSDVFGSLRTKEAIPFLIANLTLPRFSNDVNYWLKSAEAIEYRLPAAGALVRLGPDASSALIREFRKLSCDDRLIAVFVLARTKDVDSRALLVSVLGQANLERYWAEEGLRATEHIK
jgi:hypothetical protein